VKVTGVKGLPPPPTLKASIQAYAGYQAEFCAIAVGSDIEAKARSLEKQIRRIFNVEERLKGGPEALQSFSFQCLGGSGTEDARNENAAMATIRILAQAKDAASLSSQNFSGLIIENLCQAYPGFTPYLEYHRTGTPRPYLSYFPALIPRHHLEPMKVHFLSTNSTISIEHPKLTSAVADLPRQRDHEPINPETLARFGPTVMVPLGHQVFARSGDKGANVNVGFFPQVDSTEEWDWLRYFLTTEKLLELLGDDASAVQRTERVEFPNLHAVHFVLFGLLGEGVTNTNRIDALGKVSRCQHFICSSPFHLIWEEANQLDNMTRVLQNTCVRNWFHTRRLCIEELKSEFDRSYCAESIEYMFKSAFRKTTSSLLIPRELKR